MSRGPNGVLKKKSRARRASRVAKPAARPEVAVKPAVPMPQWPVTDCIINTGWESTGSAGIYMTKHDTWLDDYVFGGFLIDVQGFGLKDGFVRRHVSRQYLHRMVERMNLEAETSDELDHMDFLPCSEELAQQLIFGSILWAKRHAFRTPPEAIRAVADFLGSIEGHQDTPLDIFGREGQPYLLGDPNTFMKFMPQGTALKD